MSGQLQMFGEKTSQESTLSPLDHLAKTLVRLEVAGVSKETEAVLSLKQYGLSENADQEFLFGKMLKGHSPQTMGQILRQSSKPLLTLGAIDCEWQLLNTSWFLPQNRERVYLVGHSTASQRRLGRSISYRRVKWRV